jgi:predicted HTH transcriptional regulator
MALTDTDIDTIAEADLTAAIADGLRPGETIAFAPAAYDHPFVKDVSSLANTRGGLMLVGIAEKDGKATGFAPPTGSPRSELQQIEKRLRDGIAPQIAGVRLKAVTLAGGGCVVVLRVPKSDLAPHRVGNPRDPRSPLIYVRGNAGAYELSARAISDGWFD